MDHESGTNRLATAPTPPGVPLLERDGELEALRAALDGARQGRGSVVVVTGEPGIGKTALVHRFTAGASDARGFVGVCDDLVTPRPFGALRDLEGPVPQSLRDALRDPRDGTRLVSLLLDVLREPGPPSVLVIEDVHWADQATVDAITTIGRRLLDLPVLLVLTARDGEMAPDHPLRSAMDALQRAPLTQLTPMPLSPAAVSVMAGTHAERVLALSGGNPFLVTEQTMGT